jgi:hypothetical protein
LVPSDLAVVPRSLATALPEAVTGPAAVTGGQAPAHAPEQVEVVPVSLTHRYTARPEASVSTEPADVVAVVMTVGPDPLPLAPDAAGLAGAELLPPPPLEHATAMTATAATPPAPAASRAARDIRIHVKFAICPSPFQRGPAAPVVAPPMPVDTDTRQERNGIGCGQEKQEKVAI